MLTFSQILITAPSSGYFATNLLGKLLEKVRKRCIRAIYGYSDSSLSELLKRHNMLSIHSRQLYFLLIEVYKSLHGLNPELMQTLFPEKYVPYRLRKAQLLILPPTKTITYGINSGHFQACMQWNNLPAKIRNAENVCSFKQLRKNRSLKCTCKQCKIIRC